jgi:ADP-heptose:LPS heptosyltransferase
VKPLRFLISRTDALGDLMVSLPLVERILSREPRAEIHFLVRDYAAPILREHPGIAGTHLRGPDAELGPLLERLRPDVLINAGHRDRAVTVAAKEARVPIRVARPRGLDQTLAATHRLWKGRYGSGRHESEHALDFLYPFGWSGGCPVPPRLYLSEAERAQGEADLALHPRPRLGLVKRGSGAGAHPSEAWWETACTVFQAAGWHPVVLAPGEASDLPPTDLRGLMGRLAACDAVISPSTGPAHLAAALGVPLLALMGLRPNHSPDRWAPLGAQVQVVQYPGPEADLGNGMDRLDPLALLPHLARLR